MPVLLQILGGLICAAGLLMTGFGLPLRYQNLDNTLIAGGMGAIVGGLVLIGLGAGLRELRRLTMALERGGIPARADAQGKPGRSPRVTGPIPVPAQMPSRPEPRADDGMEERVPESVPQLEPSVPASERQRPSIFALVRGAKTEHFEIDESESVPLSPSASPRTPAPIPERVSASAEPLFEPMAPSDRFEARNTSPAALASRAAARLDMPRPASEQLRATPDRSAERPSRNLFDTVWPTEPKREPSFGRGAPSERPMFEPTDDEPRDDERRGEAFDLAHAAVKEADESLVIPPEPKVETPPAPRFGGERQEPKLESKFEPKFDLKPEGGRVEPKLDLRGDPKPATILKSGVIDGMAYTLYTDGSIEAQLPTGLMRFASIDDLRTYLERST